MLHPTSLLLACALQTAPTDPVESACASLSGFDLDHDGAPELERLSPILDARGRSEDPLVVLLVEGRLLDPLESDAADAASLLPALQTWLDDVAAEGFRAAAIRVDPQRGPRHQDGLTLLAVRRLLIALGARPPALAGAVLVGSFPDALLVRNCNWRKRTPITLRRNRDDETAYHEAVTYLRSVPEPVAQVCDLVLADTDGRWESLYFGPRTRLPTLYAVFPEGVPSDGGIAADAERGVIEFEDFFYVNDGRFDALDVLSAGGESAGLFVAPLDRAANDECSPADLAATGNPIARPDIAVSRIDARGVAYSPNEGLLDEDGDPMEGTLDPGFDVWSPDPALERRLLLDYFDRVHRYRTGDLLPPYRPASLAHDLGSGYRELAAADPTWPVDPAPELDVAGHPDLAQAVRWMDQPAVLRTVRAHSDPTGSAFNRCAADALVTSLGGPLFDWRREEQRLIPDSKRGADRGRLDFTLLYSRWRARDDRSSATLYIHTGCEAISPVGWDGRPFHDGRYGRFNSAAALLFYGDGLALVGRAKVFYDAPRGFVAALGEGATFGDAWMRYFEIEAGANGFDEVGGDIGRKRSYFWSVRGDWTLRLKRAPAERTGDG